MMKIIFEILIVCMVCLSTSSATVDVVGPHLHRNLIEAALEERCRSDNISSIEWQQSLDFLLTYMPTIDLETLPISIVIDTIHLALLARHQFPFAASVPWHIFLNDVLPYATMTEPRGPWRPLFYDFFANQSPVVRKSNATIVRVVEWMNQFAWDIVQPPIVFNASGDPTGLNEYSPFQVMQAHYASCTGLAIFLVSALRSVGIPARVAGTPHWNLGNVTCPDGDASPDCGNHDWVEVWADGAWAFVDQRGNIAVNTSWFFPGHTQHQQFASLNHSIYATSYAPASVVLSRFGGDNDTLSVPVPYFPMVWDWTNTAVPGWDVTLRYTDSG